mgnify:FL=1
MTPPCGIGYAAQKTDGLLDDFCLAGVDLFPGNSLVSHGEIPATTSHDGGLMGEVFGVIPPSMFPMDPDLSNDSLLF